MTEAAGQAHASSKCSGLKPNPADGSMMEGIGMSVRT